MFTLCKARATANNKHVLTVAFDGAFVVVVFHYNRGSRRMAGNFAKMLEKS